jgi:hypothetical protein
MMPVKVERGGLPMGRLFRLCATLLALTNGTAIAGERENALSHIAQALAVTRLCPTADVVRGAMLTVAVANGVDFERDEHELLFQVADQAKAFKGLAPEAACAAGKALYGPGGANVPGLLQFR